MCYKEFKLWVFFSLELLSYFSDEALEISWINDTVFCIWIRQLKTFVYKTVWCKDWVDCLLCEIASKPFLCWCVYETKKCQIKYSSQGAIPTFWVVGLCDRVS